MKNKFKIIRFVFLGVVLIGGAIAFFIVNDKIDKKRIDTFKTINNKGRYEIGFDTFAKEDGKLTISGWCFKKDQPKVFDLKQNILVQVVLQNKNDKKDILFLNTKRFQRDELDSMFPSETTRKYSAFTAEIRLSKLDLDVKDYDILMYYNTRDGNKDIFGITSDYSIVGGELIKAEAPKETGDNDE